MNIENMETLGKEKKQTLKNYSQWRNKTKHLPS